MRRLSRLRPESQETARKYKQRIRRGEVAAPADAVPSQHAHPVSDHEVEDPRVGGSELVVVLELAVFQPGTALQYGHLRAAGREVVGADRTAEPAADDQDLRALRATAHAGLPLEVVSGCRRASSRPYPKFSKRHRPSSPGAVMPMARRPG